ncbi:outer membrane beta-barrel protein [Aliiroseovarius sp.]|uniref:outer membrane protein n=1 Tax=Aliiroseovarius sp. TaxID=1872442 RepID=UPI0026227F73|nr:outer membrane beta-barrel protein [Aliiroseovarius sp.]
MPLALMAAGPETPSAPTPPSAATADPGWTGAYGGFTLGYALPGQDAVGVSPSGSPGSIPIGQLDDDGLNAGLRLGYRWQLGMMVIGPELAFEGGKVGDSFTAGGYSAASRLSRALSLRLKAGLAQSAWGAQLYAIAGLSRGAFDYAVTGTGAARPVAIDTGFSANGHILGLGVEKQLTHRISVTGEYEHANFGKVRLEDAGGASTQATPRFHNFKLGVNLRF